MALGLEKKAAERLGVSISDINRVADLSEKASTYWDFRDNQELIEQHFPKTAHWLTSCFNHPTEIEEIQLEMFNELIDGCGVESIRIEDEWIDNYHMDIVASYVNTGDTYSTTVLLDHDTDRFMVTSWGDFYENRY